MYRRNAGTEDDFREDMWTESNNMHVKKRGRSEDLTDPGGKSVAVQPANQSLALQGTVHLTLLDCGVVIKWECFQCLMF